LVVYGGRRRDDQGPLGRSENGPKPNG
jgi:putative transposase